MIEIWSFSPDMMAGALRSVVYAMDSAYFKFFIGVGFLLGIIIMLFQGLMGKGGSVSDSARLFFISVIVIFALFFPRTNVVLKDYAGGSLSVVPVERVPLGIALINWVSTALGSYLNNQTIYGLNIPYQITESGYIGAIKYIGLVSNLSNIHKADSYVTITDGNLRKYLANCTYNQDLSARGYEEIFGTIASSENPFEHILTSRGNLIINFTSPSTGQPVNDTCKDYGPVLQSQLMDSRFIDGLKKLTFHNLYMIKDGIYLPPNWPEQQSIAKINEIMSVVFTGHQYSIVLGESASGSTTVWGYDLNNLWSNPTGSGLEQLEGFEEEASELNQQIEQQNQASQANAVASMPNAVYDRFILLNYMSNALRGATMSAFGKVRDFDPRELAIMDAKLQRDLQFAAEGEFFTTYAIPVMKFVETFVVLLTPFVIFLIALGIGLRIVGMHVLLLVWIQIWPFSLTVVNYYLTSQFSLGISQIMGDGLTIADLETIFTETHRMIGVAGMWASMVPFLSLFVLTGSMYVFTQMASRLQGADTFNEQRGHQDHVNAPSRVKAESTYTDTYIGSRGEVTGYGADASAGGAATLNMGQSMRGAQSQATTRASEASANLTAATNSILSSNLATIFTKGSDISLDRREGVSKDEAIQTLTSFAQSIGKSVGNQVEQAAISNLATNLSGGIEGGAAAGLVGLRGQAAQRAEIAALLGDKASESNINAIQTAINEDAALRETLSESFQLSNVEKYSDNFSNEQTQNIARNYGKTVSEVVKAQSALSALNEFSQTMQVDANATIGQVAKTLVQDGNNQAIAAFKLTTEGNDAMNFAMNDPVFNRSVNAKSEFYDEAALLYGLVMQNNYSGLETLAQMHQASSYENPSTPAGPTFSDAASTSGNPLPQIDSRQRAEIEAGVGMGVLPVDSQTGQQYSSGQIASAGFGDAPVGSLQPIERDDAVRLQSMYGDGADVMSNAQVVATGATPTLSAITGTDFDYTEHQITPSQREEIRDAALMGVRPVNSATGEYYANETLVAAGYGDLRVDSVDEPRNPDGSIMSAGQAKAFYEAIEKNGGLSELMSGGGNWDKFVTDAGLDSEFKPEKLSEMGFKDERQITPGFDDLIAVDEKAIDELDEKTDQLETDVAAATKEAEDKVKEAESAIDNIFANLEFNHEDGTIKVNGVEVFNKDGVVQKQIEHGGKEVDLWKAFEERRADLQGRYDDKDLELLEKVWAAQDHERWEKVHAKLDNAEFPRPVDALIGGPVGNFAKAQLGDDNQAWKNFEAAAQNLVNAPNSYEAQKDYAFAFYAMNGELAAHLASDATKTTSDLAKEMGLIDDKGNYKDHMMAKALEDEDKDIFDVLQIGASQTLMSLIGQDFGLMGSDPSNIKSEDRFVSAAATQNYLREQGVLPTGLRDGVSTDELKKVLDAYRNGESEASPAHIRAAAKELPDFDKWGKNEINQTLFNDLTNNSGKDLHGVRVGEEMPLNSRVEIQDLIKTGEHEAANLKVVQMYGEGWTVKADEKTGKLDVSPPPSENKDTYNKFLTDFGRHDLKDEDKRMERIQEFLNETTTKSTDVNDRVKLEGELVDKLNHIYNEFGKETFDKSLGIALDGMLHSFGPWEVAGKEVWGEKDTTPTLANLNGLWSNQRKGVQ